jgi:hypothetical protein
MCILGRFALAKHVGEEASVTWWFQPRYQQ